MPLEIQAEITLGISFVHSFWNFFGIFFNLLQQFLWNIFEKSVLQFLQILIGNSFENSEGNCSGTSVAIVLFF